MDEQTQLKEALSGLMTLAEASDRILSKQQVEDECRTLGLDERQLQLICAYLEMNQVTIRGFAASEEDKSLFRDVKKSEENSGAAPKEEKQPKTGTESAYYQMYLSELEGITPCTKEEEKSLVERLLAGEEESKERLVEGNLHRVVELSRSYLGQGVLAADLIQEGNMALFLAVEQYEGEEFFDSYLEDCVSEAMKAAIREQSGSEDILNTLAADANALMKATEALADQTGREATGEELAEYLRMSKDRVETLVKISLDGMRRSEE